MAGPSGPGGFGLWSFSVWCILALNFTSVINIGGLQPRENRIPIFSNCDECAFKTGATFQGYRACSLSEVPDVGPWASA